MTSATRMIWVTGSSSGIGRALVEHVLSLGWAVQGLDLGGSALSHARYQHHQIDLTDDAALDSWLSQALAEQVPHAWVHAAGQGRYARLGLLDPTDSRILWHLHVHAAERIANLLLPAMQQQGRGRVVLVASRVWTGKAGRSQYAASKAALVSMARSWAAECVSHGVGVNSVSPAATDTPLLQGDQRQGEAAQLPPMGRFIQPQEVAASIAFLLSESAAPITGQDLVICGGSSLGVK